MDIADINQSINYVERIRDLSQKKIDEIKESQGKQKKKASGNKKTTHALSRVTRGATAKNNQ